MVWKEAAKEIERRPSLVADLDERFPDAQLTVSCLPVPRAWLERADRLLAAASFAVSRPDVAGMLARGPDGKVALDLLLDAMNDIEPGEHPWGRDPVARFLTILCWFDDDLEDVATVVSPKAAGGEISQRSRYAF